MRLVGIPIVAAIALLLSCAERADACSCIPTGPPCQFTWEAGAVFVGRVVGIDEGTTPYARRRVSVEVIETFRGFEDQPSNQPSAPIDIWTGRSDADCGFPFAVGQTYVIYGHIGRDGPGSIEANRCSRTREISKATEDLAYLRTLMRADANGRAVREPKGGRIFGRVEIADPIVNRPPLGGRSSSQPLRDVAITLTADATDAAGAAGGAGTPAMASANATPTRWQVRTNEAGEYTFDALPPGTYRVQPELPPGLYTHSVPRQAVLRDGRGCREVTIAVQHDGGLTGRLLDAGGRPMSGQTVGLIAAPEPGSPYRGRWMVLPSLSAQSAEDGTFEVAHVPPGIFAVVYEAGGSWSVPALPYPQVLYPGVTTPSDAKVVEVGPSAHVRLGDWRVPGTLGYVNVTGEVTTADAEPASGAEVRLTLIAEEESSTAQSRRRLMALGAATVRADADGRFKFAVLPGRRYMLTALHRLPPITAASPPTAPRAGMVSATFGPFIADAEPQPVSLRLPPGR